MKHEGGGEGRRGSILGSDQATAREQDGSQKSSVGRHTRQGNTGSLIKREGGRLWGEILGLGKSRRGKPSAQRPMGPQINRRMTHSDKNVLSHRASTCSDLLKRFADPED
jgi:hypothetical protein